MVYESVSYNAIGFDATMYLLICGIMLSSEIDLNYSRK